MSIFQSAFDGVSIQKKFTMLLKVIYFFAVLLELDLREALSLF